MSIEKTIREIAHHIHQAERILFITGAGMSADSGLPTYRGIGGLYDSQLTNDDMPIETALSGEMLATRPEVTWKYLAEIEQTCRGAKFNRGHEVIAQIEQMKPQTWVLTQNVDSFHANAGTQQLIEIHGNILNLHCTQCDYEETVKDFSQLTLPPACPQCDSLVRPKVVLFGEMLPFEAVEILYAQLEQGFDLVLSIGTTSVFPYIAQPILIAHRQQIPTVEINPGQTHLSDLVNYKLPTTAANSLATLWQYLVN